MNGPLFISIGDAEKLNKFLDLNPYIPREMAFVDGYDFAAYEGAGFGRFDDESNKENIKDVRLTAPELGGPSGWWRYLSNTVALSPVPKGLKFGEVPEGVLRVGGTFVIQNDDILYRWNDNVPGNHPVIEDVLKIAMDAEKNAAGKKASLFSLDGLFKNIGL